MAQTKHAPSLCQVGHRPARCPLTVTVRAPIRRWWPTTSSCDTKRRRCERIDGSSSLRCPLERRRTAATSMRPQIIVSDVYRRAPGVARARPGVLCLFPPRQNHLLLRLSARSIVATGALMIHDLTVDTKMAPEKKFARARPRNKGGEGTRLRPIATCGFGFRSETCCPRGPQRRTPLGALGGPERSDSAGTRKGPGARDVANTR